MRNLIIFIFVVVFLPASLQAQTCPTLGQSPQSAFPVCGTKALKQVRVPACPGRDFKVRSCPVFNGSYADVNAFWYKFTCYDAGTLGLLITPNDPADDYDWMLFDITGRNVNEVYTNINTQVSGNWSAIPGETGATAAGTVEIGCEGFSQPKYSKMPTLQAGHQYLLMVSNFTRSSSGYELAFPGGTANITDPLPGAFKSAGYRCLNNRVTVKLNKPFQCATMAVNGEEFEVVGSAGSAANVVSATGVSCTSGFEMDSLVLQLDRALPAGNYTLRVRNGSDGNTMLDACDNPIAAGRDIAFTVPVPQFVPFDRIRPAGCMPNTIKVLLSSPIRCSSVAADGSDFVLSGTGPAVRITGVNTFCVGQLTDSLELQLNGTVYEDGNFQIDLVRGSDGNTLISECGVETPLGYRQPFVTRDTVNAAFSWRVSLDCVFDTIFLQHDGAHGVNSWKWTSDDGLSSQAQNPQLVYTEFGLKNIRLEVTNGVCTDDYSEPILLDNTLKAQFIVQTPILCPLDMASFSNISIGNIVGYEWDFDQGLRSGLHTPPRFRYPLAGRDVTYNVRLIATDRLGCRDTAYNTLKAVASCRVAVPTAFSPNYDGVNDYLYPIFAYKTADLHFRVYGRNGQLVFESRDWQNKWDGKINGSPADVGTYAWVLEYTDTELGLRVFKKGVSTLVR
ncbi:T9SS type B sorting domain-containing protein [Chitinophaga lutea]